MQKILSIVPVFLIVFVITQPLHAQQTDPICSQLDDADCAILQNALEAMVDAETFNNAAFTVTIGGTSTGDELTIAGAGPMRLDDDGRVTAMHLTGMSGETPLEILLLDDVFYVKSDDGWSGAPLDENPDAELLANLLSGNVFLSAFATPGVFIPERIDDDTMIAFEGDIDLMSFLLTPSMMGVLGEVTENVPDDALGEGIGGDFGATDADLEGAVQFLPLLLDRDTLKVALWIDEDDGLIRRVEMLIDIVLDVTLIDPELGAVGFQLDMASDLDGHGEEFEFTAPEDFAPFDASTFDLIPLDALSVGAAPVENIPDAERYAVEETIEYGETVSGTLSDDNEQDVWGFEAEAGDTVTIILKAATVESSLDTQIYLRDDQGAELAFNDDHDGSRDDLNIFDSLVADFKIPADGEYRIVATWLTETRDGDYQLTLELTE